MVTPEPLYNCPRCRRAPAGALTGVGNTLCAACWDIEPDRKKMMRVKTRAGERSDDPYRKAHRKGIGLSTERRRVRRKGLPFRACVTRYRYLPAVKDY